MRVAIYARYSSDNQRDASIEDQVRICRERTEQEGWQLVDCYSDHAVSGASLLRPGIQMLLADAISGKFDIIVAEALDRLSRDQEDIAGIFKRLSFAGVKIVTLSEGEINHLHIGLKGTMNALFLKDLADKTRRGLRGRVEAGKSGGGKSYGYDVVKKFDGAGDPIRGDRTINQQEAVTICQIFEDYSVGTSPKAIAARLNKDGIPGPSGKSWGQSTINGNRHRGTGILNNELYIGRLVWNRLRYLKDPETGKRISRMNEPSVWVVQDVPDLRIVDQDLWDRVKARQGSLRIKQSTKDGMWDRRRPRYLLSGLIKCGHCGGGYSVISQTHLGCSTARNKGTCINLRAIKRETLEEHVLGGLRHHLMDPELAKVFAEEYSRHLNTLRKTKNASIERDRAELAKIVGEQEKLVDAICDGVPAVRLKDRMIVLEQRQQELERKLATATEEPVLIHPNMGKVYRAQVEHLATALNSDGTRTEAADILRGLIERIVLTPDLVTGTPQISLEGNLAGILSLSQATKNAAPVSQDDVSQIKLVAGVG
ncbi:MAG: recombinase family protein, partial [Planctomycetota bacterium]